MATVPPDRLETLGQFRHHVDGIAQGHVVVAGTYERLRRTLLSDGDLAPYLPEWVRKLRTKDEFKELLYRTADPLAFIRESLEPALRYLEELEFGADKAGKPHPLFRQVSIGGRKKEPAPGARIARTVRKANAEGRKVFLVHGHDVAKRNAVELFLRKLGLLPVVLTDQPNGGRTVIEKFEQYADVAYAVVLMTLDDVGAANGQPLQPRARQNVILELGAFIGLLGRERVAALVVPGVEEPSDVRGVLYIAYDEGGAWRNALARELDNANLPVDLKALTR